MSASSRSVAAAFMFALVGSGMLAVPSATTAQSREGLDEIVVTAGRVESKLQDTPIAISAFTDEDVERLGIVDTRDIAARTPNLSIGGDGQLGTTPIVLRGVGIVDPNGPTQDNPVAVYVDDVYLSRPFSNIFLLPDISRIEVLRGPQGTLFGRNASGGAVQFVTLQPGSELEASASVAYGRFESLGMRGYLLAPLASGWGVKLAGGITATDGWASNVQDGERFATDEASVVRGSVRYADDGTTLTLQADHNSGTIRSHFVNVALFPTQPIDVNTTNVPHSEDRSATSLSAQWEHNLGSVDATVIGAYVKSRSESDFDSDSSALDLVNLTDFILTGESYSLEGRLAATPSDNWKWIAGVYLFRETNGAEGDIVLGSVVTGGAPVVFNRLDNDVTTRSAAAFAAITYSFTDKFDLTTGLRYTYDRKDLVGRNLILPQPVKVDVRDSWTDVSPRLIAQYALTDDVMTYISASKGFRSGTWSVTTDDAVPAEPEYVWNYELGLKSTFLAGRARLNLAAFQQEYKDKQEQVVVRVGVTSARNAATATIRGVEAELDLLPVESLRVTATASVLDTEYGTFVGSPQDVEPGRSFDYSGNRLPFAPEFQSSLLPAYTWSVPNDGSLTVQAEWIHKSREFFNRQNDPRQGNAGYDDYNLRVIWDVSEHLSISAYGENLDDERHVVQTQPFLNQGLGLPTQYNNPRRYGAQFSYRY